MTPGSARGVASPGSARRNAAGRRPSSSVRSLSTAIESPGTMVARSTERRVTVNVCGRTLSVDEEGCRTLRELQELLQEEIGMPGQIFDVLDVLGNRILVDLDLREAIAERRTPLSAVLSDASIHFMENRREELAQMQWKLVRDQHNAGLTKLGSLCRQVSDVDHQMLNQKCEFEQRLQHLRSELLAALESAKEAARLDVRQMGERLAGLGQVLQAERNTREASFEQVDAAMARLSESRRAIDIEKLARHSLEDASAQVRASVDERLEEFHASLRGTLLDFSHQLDASSAQVTAALDQSTRRGEGLRTELDAARSTQNNRLSLMEERCQMLEARLVETSNQHQDMVEKASSQQEKVQFHMEQSKFDAGISEHSIQSLARKLAELEGGLADQGRSIEELAANERQVRYEEQTSLKEAMTSNVERMRLSLEGRLREVADAEASLRQESFADVLETVSSALASQHFLLGGDAEAVKSKLHLKQRARSPSKTSQVTELLGPPPREEALTESMTTDSAGLALAPQVPRCSSAPQMVVDPPPARPSGGLMQMVVQQPPLHQAQRTTTPHPPICAQVRSLSPCSASPLKGGSLTVTPGASSVATQAPPMMPLLLFAAPPGASPATSPAGSALPSARSTLLSARSALPSARVAPLASARLSISTGNLSPACPPPAAVAVPARRMLSPGPPQQRPAVAGDWHHVTQLRPLA
eukprot:TRINITY_DN30067_c0_g7_i1.p1 TRINITY_DN30067_c0_g7~~TRINITY_DN30067_c0_g7_i1.p1  ORF type:complete len:734 (+),score=188.79 TRINITY_DN30067_c0_g7_i1:97-2202(+)